MITTIIFDFGAVFINVDKQAARRAFKKLGLSHWNHALQDLHTQFETGKICKETFLTTLQNHIPTTSSTEIKKAWNAILLDFPLYRLEFLQLISKKYRIFLLSNTDPIHIETFEDRNGISFYSDFYSYFEKVYFSFEIGLKNPTRKFLNTL